jgi:acyl carrier protein
VTSPRSSEIERQLERFIAEELLEERYDGRDPLAAGEVDSLALEQLVEYIEQEFRVRIDDADMAAENFESLPALTALVGAKLEAAAS